MLMKLETLLKCHNLIKVSLEMHCVSMVEISKANVFSEVSCVIFTFSIVYILQEFPLYQDGSKTFA